MRWFLDGKLAHRLEELHVDCEPVMIPAWLAQLGDHPIRKLETFRGEATHELTRAGEPAHWRWRASFKQTFHPRIMMGDLPMSPFRDFVEALEATPQGSLEQLEVPRSTHLPTTC